MTTLICDIPYRLRWLLAVGYTLVLGYLTLAPDPWWILGWFGVSGREAEQAVDSTFADYLQHGTAYGLLAGLWCWASRESRPTVVRAALLFAMGHGIVTELLQHFIPLRTCDWTDGAANVAGAAAGWLFVVTCRRSSVSGRSKRLSAISEHG